MKELFKDIKGYEGLYQVSNLGRVKSLCRRVKGNKIIRRIVIMKPAFSPIKYGHISLCKNGNHATKNIHRLVAKAFIPNPENKPEVNHLDENKHNNNVANLEWVTRKENVLHGTNVERIMKTRNRNNSFTSEKPTLQISINTGEIISRYKSCSEACRQTGINNINYCCNGKRETAGGYIWRFLTDEYKEITE